MIDPETLPYRPCAGVMLVNDANQVFVGQRIDSTLDAWQMPQGGIDDGEDPEATAIRELREETGIDPRHVRVLARARDELFYDLPPELIGKVWKGRYRGQRQIWFLARFTGIDADIDIRTEHPEFSNWKWADPSDLSRLIVPFKRKLYDDVVAEFMPYLVTA